MNELTIAFADFVAPKRPISEIVAEVATHLGVTPDELLSPSRNRVMVRGRQYVMWKARQEGHTLAQIARKTKRHHTTVMSGISVMQRIMSGRRPVLENVRAA